MSTKAKSTKAKSTKAKSVKKSTDNSPQLTVSKPLTARDLRAALKGKNATERNALRRANALAVKAANKAKALQA